MQLDFLLGDEGKMGWNGLVVGDAIGVETLDNIVDLVGDLYLFLFNDFIVADHDQRGLWCDEGDFVDFFRSEEFIGDFNDSFFTEFLTVEIDAKGNLVIEGIEVEDADDLEYGFLGDMVDDRTVFDGIDL